MTLAAIDSAPAASRPYGVGSDSLRYPHAHLSTDVDTDTDAKGNAVLQAPRRARSRAPPPAPLRLFVNASAQQGGRPAGTEIPSPPYTAHGSRTFPKPDSGRSERNENGSEGSVSELDDYSPLLPAHALPLTSATLVHPPVAQSNPVPVSRPARRRTSNSLGLGLGIGHVSGSGKVKKRKASWAGSSGKRARSGCWARPRSTTYRIASGKVKRVCSVGVCAHCGCDEVCSPSQLVYLRLRLVRHLRSIGYLSACMSSDGG